MPSAGELSILDHAFVALFALAHPVLGYFSFRRLLRRIAAGEPVFRSSLYRNTVIGHWVLFAVGLGLWFASSRDLETLGFSWQPDFRWWLALAFTIAAIGFFVRQLRTVDRAPEETVREFRSSFGAEEHIMPRTRHERTRFLRVAVSAGVVEETLWRGYLIWYLTHFMSIGTAAAISAVGFGLAHAYQGLRSIPKIVAVGIVFTGLYVISGSLWLPIVLHTAVDVLQGRLAYNVFQRTEGSRTR